MKYTITFDLLNFVVSTVLLMGISFSIPIIFVSAGIKTWKDLKKFLEQISSPICKAVKKFRNFLKRHKKEIWSAVFFVLKCIRKFFTEFGRYLNGENTQEYMENASLILTDEDAIELSKRLDGRPYDMPTFCTFMPAPGIARYEYCACGLAEKYSGLDADGLFKISLHQVRNYIMETRRAQPYIAIEVATPTRLRFAIALSEYGKEALAKQENAVSIQKKLPPVLEEEAADIPEDGE